MTDDERDRAMLREQIASLTRAFADLQKQRVIDAFLVEIVCRLLVQHGTLTEQERMDAVAAAQEQGEDAFAKIAHLIGLPRSPGSSDDPVH